MAFWRLNPITRKRLARFRQMKRAWYSFWLLLIIYLLSLGAEFYCSDRPLYLRFNGQNYFPLLPWVHYSDDQFTGSGNLARVDFQDLVASEVYQANPDNRVIFPLIPYSPQGIARRDRLKVPDQVTLVFRPVFRVASIDVSPELQVVQSTGLAFFLGQVEDQESTLAGQPLWQTLPRVAEIEGALKQRFANQSSPELSTTVTLKSGRPALFSMRAFEPRSETPPARLRLRCEEQEGGDHLVERLYFDRQGQIAHGKAAAWLALNQAEREHLVTLVRQRFDEYVSDQPMTIKGQSYDVKFDRLDLTFPFPPVSGHPMGLDEAGRDVLARIIYATRTCLNFGFLLTFFSMALGIIIGAIQGWLGGWVDMAGQRAIEIWSALPFLYIMILVGHTYGRGFWLLLVLYTVFNWVGISYYMRAEFFKLRRLPYVEAARCLGLPTWRILLGHLLPNAMVPVITFFPFSLVGAIGVLSALDYLGFGLPPGTPSWGELLDQGQRMRQAWWLVFYPFMALLLTTLLVVFIGEGVRSANDPRRHFRLE
jgi:microcin C transport system permease protein